MNMLASFGILFAPPGYEPLPDAVASEGSSVVKIYGSRAVPAFKIVICEGAQEVVNITVSGDSLDALSEAIRHIAIAENLFDIMSREGK